MDPIPTTYSGAQLLMSIASSREPSRLIFPFSSQRSSNWPSTSRPPRRSASKFQTSCWPLPTRSSNDREDETPPVHHPARRRGGRVAARGKSAGAKQTTQALALKLGWRRFTGPHCTPNRIRLLYWRHSRGKVLVRLEGLFGQIGV